MHVLLLYCSHFRRSTLKAHVRLRKAMAGKHSHITFSMYWFWITLLNQMQYFSLFWRSDPYAVIGSTHFEVAINLNKNSKDEIIMLWCIHMLAVDLRSVQLLLTPKHSPQAGKRMCRRSGNRPWKAEKLNQYGHLSHYMLCTALCDTIQYNWYIYDDLMAITVLWKESQYWLVTSGCSCLLFRFANFVLQYVGRVQ